MDFSPIIAAVIAFFFCAMLGYVVIPFLHKLKFGQTILSIGPKWHEKKQGTPTMGGIMIVVGFLSGIIVAYLYSLLTRGRFAAEFSSSNNTANFFAGIGLAVGMGLIGFFDDYIKVVKKQNLGLTARQKTFLQFFVSAVYLVALYFAGVTTTWIPFIGEISVVSGIGIIFWPIALMFIYGFTNAVNLTDGIDGLAATITMIVGCIFLLASGYLANMGYNIMSAALAGSCAGFLMWNLHPAKVFMGDTGSLFLGGCIVAISFGIGKPILLIFAGFVYIVEAFSVMLQVMYYKKTKKRLFKMAPIHHHFEMCGWNEGKIVLVFSVVTFIFSLIGVLPIFFGI